MSDSDASSPLRKIRRHSCNCGELKAQIRKLSDDLRKRDNLIQDQLKFLAEEIAKQRALLNALYTKQTDVESLRKLFPIANEQQLSEINQNIVADNRKEYIEAMKFLLLPNGVKKNLKNILSAEITYEYNIDGVHGKKSLKTLNNFYKALLDSIPCSEQSKGEDELRKAIQLQKKRHFKNIGAKTKKNTQTNE